MARLKSSTIAKHLKENNMEKLLKLLSGKKSAIAGAIGLVIAYCATKGFIGEAEVLLFGGLNTIVFGVASYATGKIVYNK